MNEEQTDLMLEKAKEEIKVEKRIGLLRGMIN